MVTDAPGLVKGYAVHVFFLVLALLVSATIAISNMVLGQELRGRAYKTTTKFDLTFCKFSNYRCFCLPMQCIALDRV